MPNVTPTLICPTRLRPLVVWSETLPLTVKVRDGTCVLGCGEVIRMVNVDMANS